MVREWKITYNSL